MANQSNRSPATEWMFYSVITPREAKEIRLPANSSVWTASQIKQYEKLGDIADKHGTHIVPSTHPLL